MSIVIAFCNQKGGVGKTTTALNTGAALALKGKRVLLVDFDPQGNLTTAAGVTYADDAPTIYEALKGDADIKAAIVHKANYDVIPADITFSEAEQRLATLPGRDYLLKEELEKVSANYDYMLVDCPPSLGYLTVIALTAANYLVIPVQAHYLPLKGVNLLLDTIKLVQRRPNKELKALGVVLTMYNSRLVLAREVRDCIIEALPGSLFDTTISNATALAEAPSAGKDIFEYKADSKAAEEYKALANEIEERIKKNG